MRSPLDLDRRLLTVRDELMTVRATDVSLQRFGSEAHRYRLVPPLTESALAQLEGRIGTRLPEPYRSFSACVASGGAGPGYGLQRLAFIRGTDEIPRAARRGELRVVARRPGETLSRWVQYDADGQELDDFDLALWDACRELAADPEAARRPFPCTVPLLGDSDDGDRLLVPDGSLFLADYGCAIAARLVLNGPFRGDVWVLDGSAGGYVPFGMKHALHSPNGERADAPMDSADFLDWYEDWLNQILAPE